jgi:hypothetical protein
MWVNENGIEKPIPINADDFNPSLGATVSLNGHIFSTDKKRGHWKRKGAVWKYRTKDEIKSDPFILSLDFDRKVWTFKAESKTLDHELKAGNIDVIVKLNLEGTYSFTTLVKHDIDLSWQYKSTPSQWSDWGIHFVKGNYESQNRVGDVLLKGHFPSGASYFGDLKIIINGGVVELPLLSMDNFLNLWHNKGVLTYSTEGISFNIDFGKGKFQAEISGNKFDYLLTPKNGELQMQLVGGGKVVSDQKVSVKEHISKMT